MTADRATVFSSRTPGDLSPNRLTAAIEAARRARRPLIDLTQSNPTRAGIPYPADLLAPLAHPGGLVYEPHPLGSEEARAAVAADYARRGLRVASGRIVLTASTSEAYSLLFKILCEPGDEVLVPRPSYPLFEHLTRLDAVTAVPYDLEFHGRWSLDLARLERAMTARTRAVLAVSPNNPTGTFVTRDEMAVLDQLCAARGAAIIVDEVFADYPLSDGAGRPVPGTPLACREALAFSLGGLSKTIGLPQAKLAWMAVAGPDVLADAAVGRLEFACDSYLSVSTPVQRAAGPLLVAGAPVRVAIHDRVVANFRHLRTLVSAMPECQVLDADGGWYAVLQVPSLGTEEELTLELLTTHGILVHPGYFFDFPRESFLVVSLLTPAGEFGEGVGRILRHFDCKLGGHVGR